MADAPKTVPTDVEVADFLAGVENPQRQADAEALCALLADWTGARPMMWGPSIVGFGSFHYRYASGREGDSFDVGFSPRKQQLVLYLAGFDDADAALLAELGPHSTAKVCLNIKRLADIDLDVLRELVDRAQAKRADQAAQPGQ